jgi:predicted dehydrogenase
MSASRRQFLAASSAAAAAIAIPYYVPQRSFGANERVVTGHVGLGGQGMGNMSKFLSIATPAAVCDVDTERTAKAAKAVEARGNPVELFGDYRRLLDRKDIDAVVVSTPDHWHALLTIAACQAGKDVYVEKPLTLTIAEGRKMVEAARANKRIVQTGSQQRSDARFRLACQLVRDGKLGKIQTVLVGIPGPNHPGEPVPDSDPPANLNYDLWLGPAPWRPYNVKRVHYNFRFFWDYSGGQMTNFGAHHLDIAQWGLGMDASGPISTEGEATFHPKKWHEVTEKCRVTHTYANGAKVIVGQGQKDIKGGATFIGEKGQIFVDRGRITSDPADLVAQYLDAKGGVKQFPDSAEKLYASSDHHRNFLDCVKSRELPICDVEIGHRSATVCHLGNIAVRLGKKIQWDPSAEKIAGDDEAAQMLSRPYRAPWTLG